LLEGRSTLSPHILPRREFMADLLSWFLAGLGLGTYYIYSLNAPFLTGVKVLAGCLSFGILGGMLCFLTMERRIIGFLIEKEAEIPFNPNKFFSVSSKMFLFVVAILMFMVLVILLMVFMDINFLLTHKDSFGPEIYEGVFKEIVFAFAVLFILSLTIFGRYSRNLKLILTHHLRVMDNISKGNYENKVPVVSNDEFGMIAAKTNEMITGLIERDACQISFGRYVTPK
jgi:sigma-B regulation protein RsbU (phosphoserine phosphatase)